MSEQQIGLNDTINIGYSGEIKANSVELDITELTNKYPDCTPLLMVKRPKEQDVYQPLNVEYGEGTIKWTFDQYDAELPGNGLAQVELYNDESGLLAKSTVMQTIVHPSLTTNKKLQKWYETWQIQLIKIKEATEDAAQRAEKALEQIDEKLQSKQNKLTAGDNITIFGDVISATGGSSIDLDRTLTRTDAAAPADLVGALKDDKVDKPADPPTAAGKVLKVKTVNADSTFVCEWDDGGIGDGVSDVLVDGISIVTNGVAEIPKATTGYNSVYGLVRIAPDGSGNNAFTIDKNGYFLLRAASSTHIDNRYGGVAGAIVSGNLNYAVTAALTDDKHITLTAAQQHTALGVLGITVDDNGICHFG